MHCPKCNEAFETLTFEDVEFERCLGCKALWFDMLEKEDLLALEGSETIDVGADQVSEAYRDMRDIDCPKCEQPMIPMIDKDQFHIRYESCATCYGTFFDAGEFSDLKEHTVLERFSQLLGTLGRNFS